MGCRNAELVMARLHWIFDSVILPASRLPYQDLSGLQKCWIDNGLLALSLILWICMHQGCLSEDQPGLQKCWTCNGLYASIFDSVISLCIKAAFLRSVRAAESWIGNGLLALILILWICMHQGCYSQDQLGLQKCWNGLQKCWIGNGLLALNFWFCDSTCIKIAFSRYVRAAEMLNW